MRLQTILLPTEEICNVEELYFHRHGEYLEFDGYFNLFQIAKRKRYTGITGLKLQLELAGYSEIRLMNDRKQIGSCPLDAGQRKRYTFDFPYGEADGVFWFALKRDTAVLEPFLQGYFEGICKETEPVNIVVDICTYRREPYVCRNMRSLVKGIYQNQDLEVRKHLQAFVVDNGQTLAQCTELQEILQAAEGKIKVFPNKNAGGAGGFTRGMIEALKRKEAEGLTHILLMDDDAVFDPDTFVRLYGFLSTLKPEYRDMTVGGNIIIEEFPYVQHACGEWFENYRIHARGAGLDLRQYESCTAPSELETEFDKTKKLYSGWWCCCYSLEVVREDNLPIPFFIHCDDIEYGMRNADRSIVFINGIGAWHRGFDLTLSGTNIYYDIRNRMITQGLEHLKGERKRAKIYVWKMLTSMLFRYRYQDAELVKQGTEDFLEGPQWLLTTDADIYNGVIREKAHQIQTMETMQQQMSQKEIEAFEAQYQEYMKDFQEKILFGDRTIRRWKFLWKLATMNGWIFPHDSSPIAGISAMDTPLAGYRKKKLLLFEPFTRKGMLLQKSYRRLFQILPYYLQLSRRLNREYETIMSAYQTQLPKLTNMTTWKEHLGLKNEGLD